MVATKDNFYRLTKHIYHPPHTFSWTWKSISWEEFNTNLIKALFIASSFLFFKAFFFKADFVQFYAQSRHNCFFHLQGCYNSSTAQKWEKIMIKREKECVCVREIKKLLLYLGKLWCRMVENRKLPFHFKSYVSARNVPFSKSKKLVR